MLGSTLVLGTMATRWKLMTVSELILELTKFDGNLEVGIEWNKGNDIHGITEIASPDEMVKQVSIVWK